MSLPLTVATGPVGSAGRAPATVVVPLESCASISPTSWALVTSGAFVHAALTSRQTTKQGRLMRRMVLRAGGPAWARIVVRRARGDHPAEQRRARCGPRSDGRVWADRVGSAAMTGLVQIRLREPGPEQTGTVAPEAPGLGGESDFGGRGPEGSPRVYMETFGCQM